MELLPFVVVHRYVFMYANSRRLAIKGDATVVAILW